jgi:hypothetical protein
MTLRGVNQTLLGPVEYAWIAKRDSSGIPAGITGTLSAGSDVGFRRLKGFTQFAETRPAVEFIPVIGDNGVLGSFTQRPQAPVTANLGAAVFDQTTAAALDGRTVYTLGSWELSMRTNKCTTLSNLALILNGRAISTESGTVGNEGWYTILVWNVKAQETGRTYSGTSGAGLESIYALTANEIDTTWWEEDLSTNYGVDWSFASDPIISDYPITAHRFIRNGSTTSFTVDETPAAADSTSVRVWNNGTALTYTTDYTVTTATKTITLAAAGSSGHDVFVLYEYEPTC